MLTLRCTARLLTRLKVKPVADPPPSGTRLGDWYANLVHVGRHQLVLAVSEKTLLPVVVAAAPGASLVERLRAGVGDVLRAIQVRNEDIIEELAKMSEVALAKTAKKQVFGITTDFAMALPYYLEDGSSLLDVSVKLADTPCSPLFKTTVSPDRTTVALFESKRRVGAIGN